MQQSMNMRHCPLPSALTVNCYLKPIVAPPHPLAFIEDADCKGFHRGTPAATKLHSLSSVQLQQLSESDLRHWALES